MKRLYQVAVIRDNSPTTGELAEQLKDGKFQPFDLYALHDKLCNSIGLLPESAFINSDEIYQIEFVTTPVAYQFKSQSVNILKRTLVTEPEVDDIDPFLQTHVLASEAMHDVVMSFGLTVPNPPTGMCMRYTYDQLRTGADLIVVGISTRKEIDKESPTRYKRFLSIHCILSITPLLTVLTEHFNQPEDWYIVDNKMLIVAGELPLTNPNEQLFDYIRKEGYAASVILNPGLE